MDSRLLKPLLCYLFLLLSFSSLFAGGQLISLSKDDVALNVNSVSDGLRLSLSYGTYNIAPFIKLTNSPIFLI